ncbi:MAG TPA: hypothetical protein VF240_16425 [Pyrinomonadaceae bacterium]
MTQNVLRQGRGLTRLGLLFVVPALAALMLASPAGRSSAVAPVSEPAEPAFQVLPKPWTAVGSTGVIDEDSLNFFAFSNTDLGFRAGANALKIVARYNVTNTFDNNANPNRPGWTRLEMGSTTPNSTIIEASLFQIRSCDQQQVLICTARNRSGDTPCARCTFANSAVDFTNNLYYVEVTLSRGSAQTPSPRLHTLRLRQ